jgi:hypothetical protein
MPASAWVVRRANPHVGSAGPAIPVNLTENAYLNLREIKRLIRATLDHLGVPETTKFTVDWSPSIKEAHGETGPELAEAGLAIRAQVEALEDRIHQAGEAGEVLLAALAEAQRRRRGDQAAALVQKLELLERGTRALMAKHEAMVQDAMSVPESERFVIVTRFNKDIFDLVDPFIRAETVIHEACHAAAFALDGENYLQDADSGGHGPYWASLMRACGMEPNAHAEPVEGVHVLIRCPGCHARVSTSEAMAGDLIHGDTTARCRKCGVEMSAADLILPRNWVTPGRRTVVQCPNCGSSGAVPLEMWQRIERGEGQMECPSCHAVVTGGPRPAGPRRKINVRRR